MAKVIAFKIVLEGVETAIRNEQQLADAVKLVNKEYKDADYGTDKREEAAAQLAQLKKLQADSRQEIRDLGREYEITEGKGQESYRALNAELVNLRRQYKDLTKDERGVVGPEILGRIDELDKSLKEIDADMGQFQRNVGNYADALSALPKGSLEALSLEAKQLREQFAKLDQEGRDALGAELKAQINAIEREVSEVNASLKEVPETLDKIRPGSLAALEREAQKLKEEYRQLDKEGRAAFGAELKRDISEIDKEIEEVNKELGKTPGGFDAIGKAINDIGGFDLSSITDALSSPIGIATAVGTAAVAATAYVKELTEEYRELRNEVELLSGQTGDSLDKITQKILATSETFGASTKEVNLAANALASNIGISFEDALAKIQEGYVAGLDINGEFLDSLREYPTFFAEAFGPGEKAANAFFEVIKRGSEQGVFNDKAVDAIKEVTLRLRELPTATREALTAIGLSSDTIAEQIQEKGIGSAIATVAERLGELEADAPETGQALADIFGGPGEDAGLAFITSLKDIDQATGSLIDTTNDYQRQQLETLAVNEEFAKVQGEVAEAFGGTGTSMDNLATHAQTLLLKFLVPIVSFFGRLLDALAPIGRELSRVGIELGLVTEKGEDTAAAVDGLDRGLRNVTDDIKSMVDGLISAGKWLDNLSGSVNGAGKSVNGFFRDLLGLNKAIEDTPEFGGGGAGGGYEKAAKGVDGLTDAQREGREAMEGYTKAQEKAIKSNATEVNSIEALKKKLDDLTAKRDLTEIGSSGFAALNKEIRATQAELDKYTKQTKVTAVATEKFARDSIGFLKAELSGFQKELTGAVAGSDSEQSLIESILGTEQAIEKLEEARTEIRNKIARLGDDLTPVSLLPTTESEIGQLSQTQEAIARKTDDFNDLLTDQALENTRRRNELIEQREIQDAEDRAARIAEISSTVFSTFDGINSALANNSSSRYQSEIQDVQDRYAAEIEAAEGNAEKQEELRERQARAEQALKEKELAATKKYQTAAALASAAAGVVNILSAPTTIPDPFSTIFKVAQIAALGITTSLQIATIQRQKAERGIIIETDQPAPPMTRQEIKAARRREQQPAYGSALRREVMQRGGRIVGGWMRGQTHRGPQGGIPLTIHGRELIVEDGEKVDRDEYGNTVVINRRSAEVHREELNEIHDRYYPGKGIRLSQINTYRGYGDVLNTLPTAPRFERGGLLTVPPALSGIEAINNQRQQVNSNPNNEPATIDAQSIAAMARATEQAAYRGSREGTADGSADADRRRERQNTLNEKTS